MHAPEAPRDLDVAQWADQLVQEQQRFVLGAIDAAKHAPEALVGGIAGVVDRVGDLLFHHDTDKKDEELASTINT